MQTHVVSKYPSTLNVPHYFFVCFIECAAVCALLPKDCFASVISQFCTYCKGHSSYALILWHRFHDHWKCLVTLQTEKKNKWNNKRKLQFGNDYKGVSSLGKIMLHCSGYFSHTLPLHISHWRSLWRCKSCWENLTLHAKKAYILEAKKT